MLFVLLVYVYCATICNKKTIYIFLSVNVDLIYRVKMKYR